VGFQGSLGRSQRTGAGTSSPPSVARRSAAWLLVVATVLTAAIAASPSRAVLQRHELDAAPVSGPIAGAAAVRRGTDTEARVRFTLDGRVLAVRLLRRAPRATRQAVYGKRIRAVCGTNFNFREGVKVRRTRVWPRGQRRLRYRFRRNISLRAKWCLIEHPSGGDVAFASLA